MAALVVISALKNQVASPSLRLRISVVVCMVLVLALILPCAASSLIRYCQGHYVKRELMPGAIEPRSMSLRVLVIGAGRMGRVHLEAMSGSEHVRAVAV